MLFRSELDYAADNILADIRQQHQRTLAQDTGIFTGAADSENTDFKDATDTLNQIHDQLYQAMAHWYNEVMPAIKAYAWQAEYGTTFVS